MAQVTHLNTYVNPISEYHPTMNTEQLVQTSQPASHTIACASEIHSRLSNKMVKQLKNTLKEILNENKTKS